jgi:hypothetical protein
MKALSQNKVIFLMMIFLALSFTVYSVPVIKSNKDAGAHKHEITSLKGKCNCYKQKVYIMRNKHSNSHKKVNKSNK